MSPLMAGNQEPKQKWSIRERVEAALFPYLHNSPSNRREKRARVRIAILAERRAVLEDQMDVEDRTGLRTVPLDSLVPKTYSAKRMRLHPRKA